MGVHQLAYFCATLLANADTKIDGMVYIADVKKRYEQIKAAFELAFGDVPELYARAPGACRSV